MRAAGIPYEQGVGAAGENDRDPRAEHDPRGVGLGKKGQALGEHIARLEIGNHEDIGAPRDWGDDLLDRRRLRAYRVVEREWRYFGHRATGTLSAP